MASSRPPNSLSTERAWNKEGVAWSQRWLPYHLPKGYLGVTGVPACETEREQSNPGGIPQDVDAVRERTSISHMHLNLYIQLSLSLAQQFLFETFCASKFKPISHAFLSFLAVQRSNVQIFLFCLPTLLFTSKSENYCLGLFILFDDTTICMISRIDNWALIAKIFIFIDFKRTQNRVLSWN